MPDIPATMNALQLSSYEGSRRPRGRHKRGA